MAQNPAPSIASDQAIHLTPEAPRGAGARILFVQSVFLRCLSLVFLGLSVAIWSSAVGFNAPVLETMAIRPFAEMTSPQQLYVVVMAVLYPVTSVGLWSTLSWGRVVWVIAILFQVTMGMVYPEPPMRADTLVMLHFLTLALYFTLALAGRIIANKA